MTATICFDMYGTLFDTTSVAREVRHRVALPYQIADAIVELWRTKQLVYSFQATLMEAYQPFWTITASALTYALEYHGVDLSETEREAILATYEDLELFPDAHEALTHLEAEQIAILSNGNPMMLETLLDNSGIADRFDAVLSADDVQRFKPHPSVYKQAAEYFGGSLDSCWLISSNAWDAAGAAAAGMRVAWINRSNEPSERIGGVPDVTVSSLSELTSEFPP
jgi:2-haloacid dehalogenase